jgi:hypothetical protein
VCAEVPSSLTRICRAKFERDDLDEAMIICGLQDSQPRDVEAQSPSSHERKIGNSDTRQGPVKQTRISATWRVPRLFPFNYTMSAPRARSNAQRRSIPFENTGAHYAPVRVESPEAADYRATVLAHTTESNNDKSGSLVSPRPPHPRWNDESDPDHPYDNPYYSRPIRNSLWLPRNPCGLLDLDDTIDLSEVLTSSTSKNSGDLRSCLPSDFQPLLSEHSPGNLANVSPETLIATMPPGYSGNEEMVFPPQASGVQSSDDREVSQLERHSSVHRLHGYNSHNRSQTTPTTASWPPFHSEGRPFFDPSTRSASQPIVAWSQSSTSRDPELAEIAGRLPGVNASVELLTCSQQRPRGHMAEASTVTLAEVVTREAVVEERKVMDERMRKEEAEAEENAKTPKRPWWMGFFFSRAAT